MSIGSISSVPATYTPQTASVAPSPPAAGRDSDGDHDGSGTAAAPSPASPGRVNIVA